MCKKRFFLFFFIIFVFSCSDDSSSDTECGTYNGHQLFVGPKGCCYYYNSNDNKTYVDRSYCSNCD